MMVSSHSASLLLSHPISQLSVPLHVLGSFFLKIKDIQYRQIQALAAQISNTQGKRGFLSPRTYI